MRVTGVRAAAARVMALFGGAALLSIAVCVRFGVPFVSIARDVKVSLGPVRIALGIAPVLLAAAGVLALAALSSRRAREVAARLARSPWDLAAVVLVGLLLGLTLVPAANSGRAIAVQLALATSGFTVTLMALWPVLSERGGKLGERLLQRLWGTPRGSFLALVAGAVFVAANALSYGVFAHLPHVQDSVAQVFQGHVFLSGHCSLPGPRYPEYFSYAHIVDSPRWYSQYRA